MSTPSIARALATVLIVALALPSLAGEFSVTPVRIYMKPRDRAVAITLTNEGDTPVALQADLYAWTQTPDGEDSTAMTEDMILAPPIIKLAPGARQVVRLALLRPADASRELTYRMVVREVPEALTGAAQTVAVPIALALSMPVFVTPPTARRALACEAQRDGDRLRALCSNTGTAYAQIREIQLRRGDQVLARFEGGTYVLHGSRKAIGLQHSGSVPPGAAKLQVVFDDMQAVSFDVVLP